MSATTTSYSTGITTTS